MTFLSIEIEKGFFNDSQIRIWCDQQRDTEFEIAGTPKTSIFLLHFGKIHQKRGKKEKKNKTKAKQKHKNFMVEKETTKK